MRKNNLLLAFGFLALTSALFGARSLFRGATAVSAAAQISVSPSSIDFGDIDQTDGIVSREVTVSNTGNLPLEIRRISTSCGCTTADMDTSPIPGGQTRTLTIRFDPMTHPDQNGPITRVVYLQTSDPKQPEIEIDIAGNVMPGKSTSKL